jgi:hypothetical protein
MGDILPGDHRRSLRGAREEEKQPFAAIARLTGGIRLSP